MHFKLYRAVCYIYLDIISGIIKCNTKCTRILNITSVITGVALLSTVECVFIFDLMYTTAQGSNSSTNCD